MSVSDILIALSLLISAGSLVVAYVAYRRPSADLRLRLRRNVRELGLQIDATISQLAYTRQSHQRVLAMIGLANSGNAEIFEREADTDAAELRRLRDTAHAEFGEVDPQGTD